MEERRGVPLHTKILLSLILGAILGSAIKAMLGDQKAPWLENLITYGFNPIGRIFLNLLFLTVVPLVFSSLALGVAQLGGGKNLGRIGLKTFSFFLITMTCAVAIGLLLVNLVRPGQFVSGETQTKLMAQYAVDAQQKTAQASSFQLDTFRVESIIDIVVPRNPIKALVDVEMLSVICFALLIGFGLTKISVERGSLIKQLLEGINDLMIVIIGWAMKFAPLGVFALIFSITARFGYELLLTLGWYVAVVLVGLGIQMFIVMPLLLTFLARYNPMQFFIRARPIMITAFSTSSSSATLPTSIKVSEEELGIPPSIAGFVLPLGATMNMNGTALYEGVTVMFLAQVFGRDLSLADQILIALLSVVTAIGAAGVPGGSLPLLGMILTRFDIPPDGIAVILGVDRILDMCRTTLNVTFDVVAALFIARTEGVLADESNLSPPSSFRPLT